MSFCPVDANLAGSEQRRKRTAAWIGTMDARILQANGGNFMHDSHNWSPPMLLNAWTQTESEDFELLRRLEPKDPTLQAENRALRDKLRYLESKLQEHTDLLSQIHATSARMQSSVVSLQTTPPTPPAQQLLTPPNSVICAPAPVAAAVPIAAPLPLQRAEVIDYKIVAAADDADAIEIRLAAESLNSLSTSADSDRLEICLSGEEQQLIKRRKMEPLKTSSPAPLTQTQPQPQPLQLQTNNNTVYKLPTRRSNGKNSSLKIKEEQPPIKEQQQQGLSSEVMVSIGPNNTCVPASVFENINWAVSSLATRKLLVTIFDRETLATHSMTGKPSPAFKDQQKPLKQMLDPVKIQDIIFAVTHKSNASEKEVRNAITTKCADENKMMKIQKGKRCSLVGVDKENMP